MAQAASQTAATHEDRNGALNTNSESLSLFELRTVLDSLTLGCFLAPALRKADGGNSGAFASDLVSVVLKAAVAGVQLWPCSE